MNTRPQATYTQRQDQIQNWTPGAVRTKKRKRNLSQQPQEQRIKSPQSTWCTLHLWNTWIDKESSQNWSGGLWEQQYTYFFPFSLFVSVYVFASLGDFYVISVLMAFTICPRVLSVLVFFFFCLDFRACNHWWICFLVWLLSSFYFFSFFYYFLIFLLLIIFLFWITLFYFTLFFSFFLIFAPFSSEPCVWQGLGAPARCQAFASEVGELSSRYWSPETSQLHIILNSECSPTDLRLNAKTQLHSTTSKLQCWTPYTKQLARQEHNPTH